MTPDQAKVILDYNVQLARRESVTTAKVLAATPVDKPDYAPTETCMPAAKLVWHIPSAEIALLNGAVTGAFDFARERPANTETPQQIAAWYTENVNKALDACAAMSGEDAAKIVEFGTMFKLPAVSYLTFAVNHSIHHRGQLSAYLRPMGAKVPSIYGPSADENPFQK
jgi:uncharacterized damage-inducible protein DinB